MRTKRQIQILSNSIERVINTTISILMHSKHPDADMNLEDWLELKEITVDLWNEERNREYEKMLSNS